MRSLHFPTSGQVSASSSWAGVLGAISFIALVTAIAQAESHAQPIKLSTRDVVARALQHNLNLTYERAAPELSRRRQVDSDAVSTFTPGPMVEASDTFLI